MPIYLEESFPAVDLPATLLFNQGYAVGYRLTCPGHKVGRSGLLYWQGQPEPRIDWESN